MKAIIKDNGKLQQVEVFGKVNHGGWNVECIYFSPRTQQLEVMPVFDTAKYIVVNAFFFEVAPKGWLFGKDFSGYDWFDVKTIFQKIKNNEQIDENIVAKCKKMQEQVFIPAVIQVKTEEDIKNLVGLANNFHDSYVESIANAGNKLVIKLNTTWNIKIVFSLEGEIENNLELNFGRCGEIFHASMFLENGKIYWANDDVASTKDFCDGTKYFCAKNVSFEYEIY